MLGIKARHLLAIGLGILLSVLFAVTIGNGQWNTGKLKGRVTDANTGEGLVASILLDSTEYGCESDLDGYYTIVNIPPGTYVVICDEIAHQSDTARGVVIKPGVTTELSFQLRSRPLELIEIDVNILTDLSAPTSNSTSIQAEGKVMYMKPVLTPFAARMAMGTGYQDHYFIPPPYPPDFNTEDYSRIYENEFIAVTDRPLSTFSIDVDVASYANCRRFITSGQLPPLDAVRIEEFINYFNYDYPDPKGEHPFSVTTELAVCPWNPKHELVHIGLQGKKVETKNLPPNNLVFLLDVSGSMNHPNKLPLVKSAFRLLVDQLRKKDRVAIAVYAGAAGLVLPSTSGDEKDKIMNAIENLQAGGSTAGGAGIELAYKIAQDNFSKKGNNRVILATDGDFNVGVSATGDLVRIIEEKRQSGIFLSILGFGMGNYKDDRMEQLSNKGNGNYAYIDNLMEAKKVFVNEMGGTLFTIAKDVKLQIEFNPTKVKAYRLVGYENRLLADKDFNDDTKDAGEMGAGHTVTALYELIPAGSDEEIATVGEMKYQETEIKPEAFKSQEVMNVKLRYKKPDEDRSNLLTVAVVDKDLDIYEASETYRFSAAVAGFGMILRGSKFKADATLKDVIRLAKDSKGKDDEGYRAEFVRIVEMAELLGKEN